MLTHATPHTDARTRTNDYTSGQSLETGKNDPFVDTPETVFILGLPRSGSTLLSFLLAGMPDSLSLSEPFLAHDIYPHWRLRRYFRRLERAVPLQPTDVPRPCTPRTLLDYMSRVAASNGYRYLLIKETFRCAREWKNAPLLERVVCVGHKCIALHRHPYDITVSSLIFCRWWRGLPGHAIRIIAPRMPLFPTDRDVVEHCVNNWISFVSFCRRHSIPFVRYEDLVLEPEQSLRSFCERAGLPFAPDMLDHTHPRRAFGGIGAPEVMKRPPRPPSSESVGRKHLLPGDFQQLIATRCREKAAELQYEL